MQRQAVMPQYARAYFSSSTISKFFAETNEVQELIAEGSSSLRLVNGSWYLPGQSKFDAKCQHAYHRLTKETQYFDISKCVDPESDLPITMPSAEIFSEHMQALGIGKNDQIICYDHLGMFSVARVHFMLRYFGATNVRIMNGGFTKWLKEERPFYSGHYTAGEGI